MQININKAFSDWYDSYPDGEPTYQEAFEAGAAIELADLRAQLRDTKLAFETYGNGAFITQQRLTGEIKELKAKLAEVPMTTVPNPRVIELYDEDPGDRVCNCGFNTKGTP